jgi:hypothetical protein
VYNERVSMMAKIPVAHVLAAPEPLWTDDMIALENEFASIAGLLGAELGLSEQAAWDLLVVRLRFDPLNWLEW